jgi:hypothetical protein
MNARWADALGLAMMALGVWMLVIQWDCPDVTVIALAVDKHILI